MIKTISSILGILLIIHISVEVYHYFHNFMDAARLKRIEQKLDAIGGGIKCQDLTEQDQLAKEL